MTQRGTFFAMALAVLASVIVSLTDNYVGAVKETAGLWQFLLVKSVMSLPLLYGAGFWLKGMILPNDWARVTFRSLAVAIGLIIYFASLGILPVAQAGAGLYSAPIWIMLISVMFLGKRIGWRRVLAMVLGFVGVLALLQPDLGSLSLLSALPLLAGLFYGLGGLATKHLCADEHPITLAIGVFTAIGFLSAGMLAYFTLSPALPQDQAFHAQGWVPLSSRFLWLTFWQALGAAVAIALLANAYRFGEPDFVSVCEYSFLIFAAFWSLVLWDMPTNLMAQFGIVTIILSGVAMYILDRRRGTELSPSIQTA